MAKDRLEDLGRRKRGETSKIQRKSKIGMTFLLLLGLLSVLFLFSFVSRIFQPLLEAKRTDGEVIRVEVLNGCGVRKIAQRVTGILREKGFDVVKVDNAPSHDFPKTIVVDRKSKTMRYAKRVARSIRCRQVTSQVDPSLYLEVTVIIGKDYLKLFKFQ
ncbi:LytR C-terminal domain-containing protein [candidate division TA06 bacterium]|nr:LytR C-terminal domain-containing protein [candidate division TA06 bacterium]